jgi:hypothetical protein
LDICSCNACIICIIAARVTGDTSLDEKAALGERRGSAEEDMEGT